VLSRVRPKVGLAIGLAAIFWLGYMTGRVQNIGDVSRLYRDADTDRYSLTRGGVMVQYERSGGAGKPYLRMADGVELLDLSDWDRNSRIAVDGSNFELIRLYPQSAVDYERFRVAETLNGDGWLVEREITLETDGSVRIDHSFVARRPIQHVELAVTHAHAFFNNIEIAGDSVTVTTIRLAREQIAGGMQRPDAERIHVIGVADLPRIAFRSGDISGSGARSFVAELRADRPPQDARVPLGSEIIRVEPVSS
jgi:hypothetical protein